MSVPITKVVQNAVESACTPRVRLTLAVEVEIWDEQSEEWVVEDLHYLTDTELTYEGFQVIAEQY